MKHIFLRLALLIALFVCSSLTAQTQTLYEKELAKEWTSAEIEQQAKDGNVVAMCWMAYAYYSGHNYHNDVLYNRYPKDHNKSLELYLAAAEFGYPFAQHALASLFYSKKAKIQNEWYRQAFESLQRYADQGNVKAIDYLYKYYAGYMAAGLFKDETKAFYWALRGLELGGDSAMYIAMAYTNAKVVNEDKNFALAWHARNCVETKNRGHRLDEHPSAKTLHEAGYNPNEWETLAEPTYISTPRVLSHNADSIQQVILLTLDILEVKAEDFCIQQNVVAEQRAKEKALKALNPDPTPISSSSNYASSSSSSHTTTHATQPPAPRKRKWLSALGKVVQVAAGVASGNMAMATTAVTGGANNRMAELNQLFSYSGTVRRGQTDYSGRVISDEITAPAPMGQAHYVFYEDGYCHATTVVTCVHCYGKSTCYLCNGQGTYYHAYFKSNQPCPICGGRGVCQNCQGLGYQVTTKLWAPGEAEGYLHVQREMKSSSSSSSHSHSHSSSSSSVCPDCGGKGYRPEAYQYAAQSSFAPYHNSGGNECPICGSHTDHYHYRCTTCKRH